MKVCALVGNRTKLNCGLVADLQEMGYAVHTVWAEAGEGLWADPLSTDAMFDAAGQLKEPIDLLIVNLYAAFDDPKATILDPMDYEALKKDYDYNTLGVIRAINAFLPLLEQGQGKRIAVITNKESSNYSTSGCDGYGDHVTHAPLNMAMNQLFNGFRPQGYTFRLYAREAQDGYDPFAAEYITRNRSCEVESYKHSDENRLVLRDAMNLEMPW